MQERGTPNRAAVHIQDRIVVAEIQSILPPSENRAATVRERLLQHFAKMWVRDVKVATAGSRGYSETHYFSSGYGRSCPGFVRRRRGLGNPRLRDFSNGYERSHARFIRRKVRASNDPSICTRWRPSMSDIPRISPIWTIEVRPPKASSKGCCRWATFVIE
jgi:hypothetical protein